MNCFPCFSNEDSEDDQERLPVAPPVAQPKEAAPSQSPEDEGIAAKSFTFREMATATKNFRQEFLIKDDGFGRVFKGTLSGQVVAIKQLDRNGTKGSKDFLDEVRNLSSLKHPNLIKLIGYCVDGDQRILVFEFAPLGSLEPHLLAKPADESPLNWMTRMKIATGAAEGLQYLHEQANPPVIYSDFKSSKILLDEEFNPRLCDFGLAKLAQSGQTASTPPRVMGTYGYSAPEYARTGELTLKSDIYSFGVVLLELITGRRAIDPNRPANEQNLVTWAQPIFRDPKRFSEMADPLLDNKFSVKSLNQAVGVAAMCLQEEPTVRPYISDVVTALSFLDFVVNDPPALTPSSDKESVKNTNDGDKLHCESESSSLDQNDNDNDDDNSDSPSEHEDDINNDLQADSSSDHEDNDNNNEDNNASESDDHKSNSSIDDEDNALVIEDENRNSSSSDNSVYENSEDETYDDQKSQTKSIKKGKAMELSDDESMYSSGSSRSSSSSINDELGGEKTSRQTTQKVKSKRNSVGHLSTKKSKSRWRKAKSVLKHET